MRQYLPVTNHRPRDHFVVIGPDECACRQELGFVSRLV